MKITVDVPLAKRLFERYDRDYYSIEGIEAIIDYYHEIDDNVEFDVIAICCDFNEYGEGCALSFSDMISDYEAMVMDEYADIWHDMDDREKASAIVDELEHRTTVLHVSNGNYIVIAF